MVKSQTSWHFKPGVKVSKCPTCRRTLGRKGGVLNEVDFDKKICRCGRPWNGIAEQRLRNWLCSRKVPYERYEDAARAANDLRMEAKGITRPYPCPFGNHYHVGREIKSAIA